jgi:diguanylate cyclase (GGDEF)-like protein/PAS domain S-box-containing protein
MKFIYELRMRSKLIIAFTVISLFSGLMGLVALKNMRDLNSNSAIMHERNSRVINDITLVKSNLVQINLDIYMILDQKNSNKVKTLVDEINTLKNQDDNLLADYEKHIVDNDDRKIFGSLKNILSVYRQYREELLGYIHDGDYDKAWTVYNDLEIVSDDIVKNTEDYIEFNSRVAEKYDNSNKKLYHDTIISTITIGTLGFLISILVGYFIAYRISGKIKIILDFAKSLTEGNMEHKIIMESRDEIGQLAIELNKAADKRREYEENLMSSYEELEASYEEVRALEQELREKYNDLEASFEEITALEQELREKYTEISINEELLRNNEEWYKLITEASYDALWDWNIKDGKMFFSDQWYNVLGYDKEKTKDIDWTKLVNEEDYEGLQNVIKENWENKSSVFTIEYRIRDVNGIDTWMQTIGKTLFDLEGKPYRLAGSHKNITDIKEYQHRLEYIAYHDYLTDLPNRQYMHKVEKQYFDKKDVYEHNRKALIFIDIDNFKYINDTLGHNFGDFLICAIADRLNRIKKADDLLIRLGGDEFVIILNSIEDRVQIESFCNEMLNSFESSFNVDNNYLQVTSSIGIAIFPEDGERIDDLLTKADIAMYKSKSLGKNSYTFYHSGMNDKVIERMEIEKYLRNALDKNEFILYYQPQVDADSGMICSFEALIRWNSPELGFVPPDRFITLAEENHRIIDIGNWVLRSACEFIKEVHTNGYDNCYISINVSVIQLMQSDFVDNVLKIINDIKIDPNFIELEITESIFIETYDSISDKLNRLREIGIKIALDDFGKGYSSLSYLKQLPISTLKIDKIFIDDVAEEHKISLVENIIDIGHKMNLKVVAEGVETEEQLNYLNKHSCDRIQGYYFSRPVPQREAISLLNKLDK